MAKYISKDAIVAEIERLHKAHSGKYGCDEAALILEDLEDFLDTLDVKEVDIEQLNKLLNWWKEVTTEHSVYKAKEVDLEKEIGSYIETILTGTNPIYTKGGVSCIIEKTAKHFYELGLKAQKGE